MKSRLRINHVVIILIVILTSVCSASSSKLSQADNPWKIVVAPKDEPGKAAVRASAQGKLERLKEKK